MWYRNLIICPFSKLCALNISCVRIFALTLLLLQISCKSKSSWESRDSYFKSFDCPTIGEKDIRISKLDLNKIEFDSIHTSFIGSVFHRLDTLYFVDYRFGWVFQFDLDGRLLGRTLGRGKGPSELPTAIIDACQFGKTGQSIFIGPSSDVHVFDKEWNRGKSFFIDHEYSRGELHDSLRLSPNNPGIYGIEYLKFFIRLGDKCFYMPVVAGKQEIFKPYYSIEHYYQTFIIAKVEMNTGKIIELFGKRTPLLTDYQFLSQFRYISFDVDYQKRFYVCHEIDSLIYIYNQDRSIHSKFGFSGLDMVCDYKGYSGGFDRTKLIKDRESLSYYDWIEIIDETGILFRSYVRGPHSDYDGLQIYQDGNLIGDVNVPKGFRVISYRKPYYYSNGFINDEAESIWSYRFKLNP